MTRPTWMMVVGVLAIILGVWGMVGSLLSLISSVYFPIESEREIVGLSREGEDSHNDGPAQRAEPPQSDKTGAEPNRLLTEIPWFVVATGTISLLLSGAYLLAGVLLLTKPFGAKVFLSVIAASILWTVIQAVFYTQAQLNLLMAVIPAFAPHVLVDALLGGVVWAGIRLRPPEPALATHFGSSKGAFSIMSKPLELGLPIITGSFAAICVLVFPFWIMGIPGVDNEYARGWKMGLDVLIWYPIAWVGVFGLSRFLRKKILPVSQASLDVGVSICLSLFLVLALLRLGQALSLIAT